MCVRPEEQFIQLISSCYLYILPTVALSRPFGHKLEDGDLSPATLTTFVCRWLRMYRASRSWHRLRRLCGTSRALYWGGISPHAACLYAMMCRPLGEWRPSDSGDLKAGATSRFLGHRQIWKVFTKPNFRPFITLILYQLLSFIMTFYDSLVISMILYDLRWLLWCDLIF